MVNLLHSKTFRPQPLQLLVTKQIMTVSCLESWAQKWSRAGLYSIAINWRDFGTLHVPTSETLKGCPHSLVSDASNPGVHPITVYHGMWWDSVACPTECRVPFHPMVLGIWGMDMGHCGTSQVIPSHPMGLIGIAATVPGTFGIPNVPMDICWQC